MAVTATKNGDIFIFSGRAYHITEAKNKALEPYGCMVHDYGLVLELVPDAGQRQSLAQQIGNARFMRNRYLNDRIAYYEETKGTLSVNEYKSKHFPELRKEFGFLQLSDKFALESAVEHVDAAYKNFFSGRAAFPKFASKWKPAGNSYTTKQTNGNIRLEEADGLPYIRLPKIGLVRFVLPRKQTLQTLVPHGTSILAATVKKKGDRYTVSLQLETVITSPAKMVQVSIQDVLAADMGLKLFAVIGSQGWEKEIPNPRWIRKHEKRLRRLQKSLSRKKYDQKTHTGSRNWEKARRKVAAEQRKIADQRKDFQHKLSRRIADSCSAFCCEDLNIRGMVKNQHLSNEVSSVSWGQFLTMVKYKLERQGKYFIQVSRWYPSSQVCSCCGYRNREVKDLGVRQWTCPECGTYHDRDINAKDNILAEGIRLLGEAGVSVAA
ncbi:transposase [Ruminococcus sp. CLA-AA-H200]|uniref:Transposase n=1 Tax=Ruminococcus turbiniformis TaxID=2881258 RepID=A0ABS8G0X5_9FIRM|nr:transposase [Ruminococcus turbiniformis]MCC2254594.1 transposase [Ruminococcus turbiniformis]